MKTLPASVSSYQLTSEFCESSIPKGRLKAHPTRDGVWRKIIVNNGRLKYSIMNPAPSVILDKNHFGGVEPGTYHQVKAPGTVHFQVEFYR